MHFIKSAILQQLFVMNQSEILNKMIPFNPHKFSLCLIVLFCNTIANESHATSLEHYTNFLKDSCHMCVWDMWNIEFYLQYVFKC